VFGVHCYGQKGVHLDVAVVVADSVVFGMHTSKEAEQQGSFQEHV
jgi:hypothetical protein